MLLSKITLAMIVWFCFSGPVTAQQEIDSAKYWIHDDFSSFQAISNYILEPAFYPLTPHEIELKTVYANFNDPEGNCNIENPALRIRGLKDGGYAEFTVPDANIVTINIKAHSAQGNRVVHIHRNDIIVKTFENLDRNNCRTFIDSVFTSEQITYKINGYADPIGTTTGDSTSPVVITSIFVEKYIAPIVTHIITVSATEGGNITPVGEIEVAENGEIEVMEGDDITFTITLDEGYALDSLLLDGEMVTPTEEMTYTISDIRKDYTIHAVFTIIDNINQPNLNLISIYPNPVENHLMIENNQANLFNRIEIYNTIGQSVISQTITHDNLQKIDVTSLPKGIYILHLSGASETVSYKFVKN